jgi:8-oxo-dGTP pyrophosphatase MutT (NUDIX family)
MKDYIPYLRKMIGHAPCQAIGVTALIVDEEGAILWEKRTDNGLYCLPGGSLNYEEKVIEGLKREVLEETVTSGPETTLLYPNGDITNYVDFAFYCPIKKKEVHLASSDGESTQLFFAKPEAFPPKELWLRGMEPLLERYQKKDFALTLD